MLLEVKLCNNEFQFIDTRFYLGHVRRYMTTPAYLTDNLVFSLFYLACFETEEKKKKTAQNIAICFLK